MDIKEKNDVILTAVKEKFGFVPNLFRTLSISPAVSDVYLKANAAMEEASVSAQETHGVNLAVSVENGCKYCVAAHSVMCKMVGIEVDEIDLIKQGKLPEEKTLAAAVKAALLIMEKKGWLNDGELSELESQGVGRGKIYEIIALIGIKTIANYVNHIGKTVIDDEFKEQA